MYRGTEENHEKPVTLIFLKNFEPEYQQYKAQAISMKHTCSLAVSIKSTKVHGVTYRKTIIFSPFHLSWNLWMFTGLLDYLG